MVLTYWGPRISVGPAEDDNTIDGPLALAAVAVTVNRGSYTVSVNTTNAIDDDGNQQGFESVGTIAVSPR